MAFAECYWCGSAVEDCTSCYNEYGKMETCQNCQGAGFLCTKGHGVTWQGSELCPEEYKETLDNWVRYHIREEPWEKGPTVSTLPVQDVDALTYLAFLADFNVLYQRLTFDERGLAAVQWLTACRNAAIAAGGRPPRVLRAGPIPDSEPPR